MEHKLVLKTTTDPDVVPSVVLVQKQVVSFGKTTGAGPVDVSMKVPFISRRHAELRKEADETYTIVDVGSSNGTFVNGIRVLRQALADGDMIQFGGGKEVVVGAELRKPLEHIAYVYHCSPQSTSSAKSSNKRKAVESAGETTGATNSSAVKQSRLAHNTISPPPTVGQQAKPQNSPKLEQSLAMYETMKAERDVALNQAALQQGELADPKRQLGSLQCVVASLEETISKLKRENERLEAETKANLRKNSMNDSAVFGSSSGSARHGGLSSSTIADSLKCMLCEGLLVDAAVLPCSHGFCRACIEGHWRGKGQGQRQGQNRGSAGVVRCHCPVCGGAIRKASEACRYVRSDHLDYLVWLLLESGDGQASKDFEAKTRRHREVLKELGLDPDAPAGQDWGVLPPHSEDEGPVRSGKATVAMQPAVKSDAVRGASRRGGSGGSGGYHSDSDGDGDEVWCEYCGTVGHVEGQCPHRMYDDDSDGDEDDV